MIELKDVISGVVGLVLFALGLLPILNKFGIGPDWMSLSFVCLDMGTGTVSTQNELQKFLEVEANKTLGSNLNTTILPILGRFCSRGGALRGTCRNLSNMPVSRSTQKVTYQISSVSGTFCSRRSHEKKSFCSHFPCDTAKVQYVVLQKKDAFSKGYMQIYR